MIPPQAYLLPGLVVPYWLIAVVVVGLFVWAYLTGRKRR